MRQLIVVAVVSALGGAGVTLWAKSATGIAQADPPSSVRISPHEIMKSSKDLPVQAIVDPI